MDATQLPGAPQGPHNGPLTADEVQAILAAYAQAIKTQQDVMARMVASLEQHVEALERLHEQARASSRLAPEAAAEAAAEAITQAITARFSDAQRSRSSHYWGSSG